MWHELKGQGSRKQTTIQRNMANILQNTQLPDTDILKNGNVKFQAHIHVPADEITAISFHQICRKWHLKPCPEEKSGNPTTKMFPGEQEIGIHLAFKLQKLLTG